MKTMLAAAVIAAFCLLQVSGRTVKERLLNDLTDEYEAAVGPPGVVQLKMNINFVCAYQDKDTGFIVSTVFEYYSWQDERLAWSAEEYGGLSMMRVPSDLIWKPDMAQYHNIMADEERDDDVMAIITANGTVIWVPRAIYRTPCADSGDKITCNLRIGSWAYSGDQIKLQVEGPDGLDLNFYNADCPLEVASHEAKVVAHTYPCCVETYPSMDISIVFKERQ